MKRAVIIIDYNDPSLSHIISRIRSSRKDMQERKTHVCDPAFCAPQNDPSDDTSNVYLCKYGQVHVCSADTCELYQDSPTRTCPISGQHMGGSVVSSYSRADSRTWTTPSSGGGGGGGGSAKKARRQRTRPTGSQQRQNAETLVSLLLYSNNRVRRNEDALAKFRQQAQEARSTYIKQQKDARQLPYATDLYRIEGHFMQQTPPLRILEFDEARRDYYADVICQLWDMVTKYHHHPAPAGGGGDVMQRIDFTSVALGVLYAMCMGMHYSGRTLLPADTFLAENLPKITDLGPYFQLDRSIVTGGDNIIIGAYENAIRKEGPDVDIGLDGSRLAERPDRAQGEVYQLREGDPASVRYRFTTSGGQIFMPVSRKKKGC